MGEKVLKAVKCIYQTLNFHRWKHFSWKSKSSNLKWSRNYGPFNVIFFSIPFQLTSNPFERIQNSISIIWQFYSIYYFLLIDKKTLTPLLCNAVGSRNRALYASECSTLRRFETEWNFSWHFTKKNAKKCSSKVGSNSFNNRNSEIVFFS